MNLVRWISDRILSRRLGDSIAMMYYLARVEKGAHPEEAYHRLATHPDEKLRGLLVGQMTLLDGDSEPVRRLKLTTLTSLMREDPSAAVRKAALGQFWNQLDKLEAEGRPPLDGAVGEMLFGLVGQLSREAPAELASLLDGAVFLRDRTMRALARLDGSCGLLEALARIALDASSTDSVRNHATILLCRSHDPRCRGWLEEVDRLGIPHASDNARAALAESRP